MPSDDAAVELQYLSLQYTQLTAESSETRAGHFREPAVGFIRNDFQQSDGRDDPQLRKIARIELMTAVCLADEEMACTMKHQTALLLDRLGRHEQHAWPRDCFANRLRVRGVILLPLVVWLHIGRRHQPHHLP